MTDQQESENTIEQKPEITIAEYDQALDIAQHTDVVIHEVAAIIWGANTLLLGFILEVDCGSSNQRLVVLTAALGIITLLYVPWVQFLTKKSQRVAFEICREIEREGQFKHRLHTRIRERYLKKGGQRAILFLSVLFVIAWVIVIHNASRCLKTTSGAVFRQLLRLTW
jgi:hypothetical protein